MKALIKQLRDLDKTLMTWVVENAQLLKAEADAFKFKRGHEHLRAALREFDQVEVREEG